MDRTRIILVIVAAITAVTLVVVVALLLRSEPLALGGLGAVLVGVAKVIDAVARSGRPPTNPT